MPAVASTCDLTHLSLSTHAYMSRIWKPHDTFRDNTHASIAHIAHADKKNHVGIESPLGTQADCPRPPMAYPLPTFTRPAKTCSIAISCEQDGQRRHLHRSRAHARLLPKKVCAVQDFLRAGNPTRLRDRACTRFVADILALCGTDFRECCEQDLLFQLT